MIQPVPESITRTAMATLAMALASCAGLARPGTPLLRQGDEIVVCGQLFHTGTPVVLWTDPGGYDAYRPVPRFRELRDDEQPEARYGERRDLPVDLAERVAARGWELLDLQQVVHLFVLHYDVAGVSRRCFQILQDKRSLSVHFMLDVDGTIYQTLDLKERAWHATIANNHSIGIEIAHPGAYPQPGHPAMRRWYETDEHGLRMKFPAFLGDPGLRRQDYIPRPARPGLFHDQINGRPAWQRDFTKAQYEALAHLTATLTAVLPAIELEYPRDEAGELIKSRLSPAALHAHRGVVGHFHVQDNKQDPGPAMAWDRLLGRARQLLGNGP